ncbi:dCTP deaminase domain-containing protein [Dendronalium sp. ChiSLP03b]|uniref:dCTP deaminase domain-containing protein n=1 Tax=Dendronalium sp. ChiSLP03b TaxID=3075381 RepID=UPI002AD2136E|nr:deoxycytidine triphosphate deaminase [Dendronalium sp. ChiSLP03b]MDZ8205390.1 deoxycytidine triphosphate deaminase [Dendronalium sp. ChiSLP03b]
MSMLSDNDIKQELGINILIYPFTQDNLKGASYNLTASKYAWSLSTKQSIYNSQQNKIIINQGDTALIETNETVWVSKKITGTYHSRVTQVSQGTGHIGTTLDPNYIGPSLISITNHSNYPIELIPEITNFVTLAFQYLCTESSREHGNTHGRRDILGEVGIQISREESNALDKPYMSNKDLLLLKLEECKDYQSIKRDREIKANHNKIETQNKDKKIISRQLYATFVGLIFMLILSSWYLQTNQKQLGQKNWYASTTSSINTFITIMSSALVALITVDLERRI